MVNSLPNPSMEKKFKKSQRFSLLFSIFTRILAIIGGVVMIFERLSMGYMVLLAFYMAVLVTIVAICVLKGFDKYFGVIFLISGGISIGYLLIVYGEVTIGGILILIAGIWLLLLNKNKSSLKSSVTDDTLSHSSMKEEFWKNQRVLLIFEVLIFSLPILFVIGYTIISGFFWNRDVFTPLYFFYIPAIMVFVIAIIKGYSSTSVFKRAYQLGLQISDNIFKQAKVSVVLSYSYITYMMIFVFIFHFTSLYDAYLIDPVFALLTMCIIDLRATMIFFINPDSSHKPRFGKFLLISFLLTGILMIIYLFF
jgi:hypothetical protein